MLSCVHFTLLSHWLVSFMTFFPACILSNSGLNALYINHYSKTVRNAVWELNPFSYLQSSRPLFLYTNFRGYSGCKYSLDEVWQFYLLKTTDGVDTRTNYKTLITVTSFIRTKLCTTFKKHDMIKPNLLDFIPLKVLVDWTANWSSKY